MIDKSYPRMVRIGFFIAAAVLHALELQLFRPDRLDLL